MDLIVPLRPARLPHRLWHAVFSAGLLLAPVLAVAGDALPAWSVPVAQGKPAARHENGFVAVDGRLYLTRGHMAGFVPWLDVFDPATGQWRALADAPHARDHFHAVVIDGRIYAAGGRRTSHDTGETMSLTIPEVDVYEIASGRWSTLPAPLPTQRAGAPAVAMDGRLVVLGGESPAQVPGHGEVEAYDPATQRWSTLPPLPRGRHGTQATMLDGVLHVAAGNGDRGGGPELDDHLTFGAKRASRND